MTYHRRYPPFNPQSQIRNPKSEIEAAGLIPISAPAFRLAFLRALRALRGERLPTPQSKIQNPKSRIEIPRSTSPPACRAPEVFSPHRKWCEVIYSEESHMHSKPSPPSATQPPQPATDIPTPTTALSRSVVHRRLPLALRVRLDEAILLRPRNMPTLESIAAHLDLARYGISPKALQTYARRLEDLARPAATGQLLTVVLGCLPPGYRRRVHDGTEVLLLSRLAQVLSSDKSQALSVADLARLVHALATLARSRRHPRSASAKQSQRASLSATRKVIEPAVVQALVHGVYGANLDPEKASPPGTPTSTQEARTTSNQNRQLPVRQ